MCWNFVSSSRERIEQAKADWQAQRMGEIPGEHEFIPLPDRRQIRNKGIRLCYASDPTSRNVRELRESGARFGLVTYAGSVGDPIGERAHVGHAHRVRKEREHRRVVRRIAGEDEALALARRGRRRTPRRQRAASSSACRSAPNQPLTWIELTLAVMPSASISATMRSTAARGSGGTSSRKSIARSASR